MRSCEPGSINSLRISAQFQASLFWDIAQRTLAFTDVSGQPVGPIFKGQCLTILRSPVDTGSVLATVRKSAPVRCQQNS